MDKELKKEIKKLNEISNEPYHKDKLAKMLAQMGNVLLFIPSIKEIVEDKARQN